MMMVCWLQLLGSRTGLTKIAVTRFLLIPRNYDETHLKPQAAVIRNSGPRLGYPNGIFVVRYRYLRLIMAL